MDENVPHPQFTSHRTRMLRPGSAETDQSVLGGIVALRDRNFSQCANHAGVGDSSKSFSQLCRLILLAKR